LIHPVCRFSITSLNSAHPLHKYINAQTPQHCPDGWVRQNKLLPDSFITFIPLDVNNIQLVCHICCGCECVREEETVPRGGCLSQRHSLAGGSYSSTIAYITPPEEGVNENEWNLANW